MTQEQRLARAETLARKAAGAEVREHQLALALVHLKRHRDVRATLDLLKELKHSPFAGRSNRSRKQLTGLEEHVRQAIQGLAWDEAAEIVGWARRLVTFYQPQQSQGGRG